MEKDAKIELYLAQASFFFIVTCNGNVGDIRTFSCNRWDCGMFMLKYIDFHSRGLPLSFSQVGEHAY